MTVIGVLFGLLLDPGCLAQTVFRLEIAQGAFCLLAQRALESGKLVAQGLPGQEEGQLLRQSQTARPQARRDLLSLRLVQASVVAPAREPVQKRIARRGKNGLVQDAAQSGHLAPKGGPRGLDAGHGIRGLGPHQRVVAAQAGLVLLVPGQHPGQRQACAATFRKLGAQVAQQGEGFLVAIGGRQRACQAQPGGEVFGLGLHDARVVGNGRPGRALGGQAFGPGEQRRRGAIRRNGRHGRRALAVGQSAITLRRRILQPQRLGLRQTRRVEIRRLVQGLAGQGHGRCVIFGLHAGLDQEQGRLPPKLSAGFQLAQQPAQQAFGLLVALLAQEHAPQAQAQRQVVGAGLEQGPVSGLGLEIIPPQDAAVGVAQVQVRILRGLSPGLAVEVAAACVVAGGGVGVRKQERPGLRLRLGVAQLPGQGQGLGDPGLAQQQGNLHGARLAQGGLFGQDHRQQGLGLGQIVRIVALGQQPGQGDTRHRVRNTARGRDETVSGQRRAG